MPLDPIVSLSVAIAEAPGSYAFFLGSGVSRDAGVPTGGEVFWNAVGELYRLENASETTPDDDALSAWLTESGRGDLGYSDVLELIAPDAASRRDYLAKHFEGIEPGPTHTRLADLAHRGLAKVFVTTNFDRLLERALQARGIEPVVVTSDADLAVAPPREHSACYVLKPHGDYLQDTIRNTPAELAELEPAMTAQLQEVFDRYGVVVLGYSGSDKAISDGLRARRGRYGLYWVARGALVEPGRSLVEAVAGRVITRPGAAEFLADLDRRLAVFASHPSGQTPLAVHDETVLLLRRSDTVGLGELLREEHRALEAAIADLLDGKQQTAPTVELLEAAHREMLPALERRMASLLPLVLHDAASLGNAIRDLADLVSRPFGQFTYTFWRSIPEWSIWWVGQALGAFAVRQRRLGRVQPMLTSTVSDHRGRTVPLVPAFPGDMGAELGKRLNANRSPTFVAPWWEQARIDIASVSLFAERYPEMVRPEDEPLRSLVEFNFIHSAALGLAGHRTGSTWTMYAELAEHFAARLHADAVLREEAANAVGLDLATFDERVPAALKEGNHFHGAFGPDLGAIALLGTGKWDG